MTDLSWIMCAKALAAARECVALLEKELSVRLKLSHPDFLEHLQVYAKNVESVALRSALARLARYAPHKVQLALMGQEEIAAHEETCSVTTANRPQYTRVQDTLVPESDEIITYKGRPYYRFRNGYAFKGVYRGQPIYG